MGASESKGEDNFEVLNNSQMDLIEKTADYIRSVENDSYGRFKLMQYRVTKRQFAIIERVTSQFQDFQQYCIQVDKRLKFNSPHLVKWVRAYKSCEQQYCTSFFKVFINVDYIPYTLLDQLNSRKKRSTHCGEKEIFNMIDSVLSALIYLKSQSINHNFIQPKTILYDQTNRSYQITDIQFFNGGINEYQQFLFGQSSTSCYLSPELLKALSHRQQLPEHSPSKSDIFSLGLCALEMATMKSVQNIFDFHDFSIFQENLMQLIQEVQTIYSDHLSQLLISMLKLQENQRPDFDDLAYLLKDLSQKPQFIDSTQSLRASVISEELVKSNGFQKGSHKPLERSASSNLIKSTKSNNTNELNDKIKNHNINSHNNSSNKNNNSNHNYNTNKNNKNDNSFNNNNNSNNKNNNSSNIINSNNNNILNSKQEMQQKSAQSILKKYKRKEGELVEVVEEENHNIPYNDQYQSESIEQDQEQQQPFIRVLDPIYTAEQEEIHSLIAIPSNQQLNEISSINLVSQRNTKQLSAYNQEDLQLQYTNKSLNNTAKKQNKQNLSNFSPHHNNNNINNINNNKDQFQQNNLNQEQNKNNSYKLSNRPIRSQSQISTNQKKYIDPIEEEYEEFKTKQKQLQLQQQQKNKNDQYQQQLQEKQLWEQQQQQHIQDSMRHHQQQQSYIQSQINFSHHYLDDTKRNNINSQQSLTQQFNNHPLQNQSNNLRPSYQVNNNSPLRSTYSTVKSPNRISNNRNTINNQNNNNNNNNNTPMNYTNRQIIPNSGRNSQMRSLHQLNKSPKLNMNSRQQFYNDENEQNYDNRPSALSQIMNIDNTIYHDYNTNNLNNSKFDQSYMGSKIDMSMLSNYELKDIHIQPIKKNNNDNITNTLNMLEERIDKIDQNLSNIKRPLRSSSNHSFAFHQNSKPLTSNNINYNKQPTSFQQQLKQQSYNNNNNKGSSAKTYSTQNDRNYDSHIPYPTPFQQAYNNSHNNYDNFHY